MEGLFTLLRAIAPMSAALEARLRGILVHYLCKKGDLLLRKGEIARNIFYIEKGLLRSFHMAKKREVCNWFMKENDICISVVSFFGQQPSTDNIIAVEDCELWGIHFKELEETYTMYPEFERHGRIICAQYYVRSELRHQDIRRTSSEDKYEKLMRTEPDLVRRVSDAQQLASFLNISRRTWCRIRGMYKKNKKGPADKST